MTDMAGPRAEVQLPFPPRPSVPCRAVWLPFPAPGVISVAVLTSKQEGLWAGPVPCELEAVPLSLLWLHKPVDQQARMAVRGSRP